MIQVEHLVKWYGPNLAVDGLSFHVPRGQVVGFLGPNGAGKSTTLRMLTGYLPPTAGRARIAGHDALRDSQRARASLGYMPESTPLYPEMRVEEYLHFRGRLHGMRRRDRLTRIDALVPRCGLALVRRRLIGALSKGNRQRVGLAAALLHNPPLLILDEPTAGLDPNQISEVRKLIQELRGDHTILLSTHILPEVERCADRAIIIARGRIVADGSLDELRDRVAIGADLRVEARAPAPDLARAIAALPGVRAVEALDQPEGWSRVSVKQDPGGAGLAERIGAMAQRAGWPLRELRAEQASLEAFFVRITAQQAQGPAPEQPPTR
jgi:ABC-2 type transport system ATP-binding protein